MGIIRQIDYQRKTTRDQYGLNVGWSLVFTGSPMIILCHKCAGPLSGEDHEIRGLGYCCCISGWIRGFEKSLTREEAIRQQIKHYEDTAAWMGRRNAPGDSERVESYQKRIADREALLKNTL